MSNAKCGKCLLRDYDGSDYKEKVQAFLNQIPNGVRTPPYDYKRRLEVCAECDMLSDGMCMECGCYVQVRAAKAPLYCPIGRWETDDTK